MPIKTDGKTVYISGAVHVADCSEIHELLFDMSRKESEIIIDSNQVEEADFAFVQLLAATQKYAEGHNLRVDVSSAMGAPVRELIRLCGLQHILQA